MITEDYVSFETAKLLKEKRFDEECSCFYDNIVDYGTPGLEVDGQLYYQNSWLDDEEYAAPTLQMAMKWLRDMHNIHVVPKYDFYGGDYTGRIYDGRRKTASERDDYIAIVGNSTYEQAAEAAIKYCLENLI